jgi:pimeloyl-ACP methyl ester carboxylesterase
MLSSGAMAAQKKVTIPKPNAVVDAVMDDGAIIRLRRHGTADGPRLALSHGNGMAIDGYFPFWKRLLDRYDLVLYDFRNHGQNPIHDPPNHNWQQFIRDDERLWHIIRERFGAKPIAGVFHSLSAVASVMHTVKMGKRWDPLVLFDPPIHPRDGHPLQALQKASQDDIAGRARRRKERYKDPSDLAAIFAHLPQFRTWQPEAYELMARATLRHDEAAGDWVLACPRELEAHIFSGNRDGSIWPRLRNFPVPFKLVCGDPDGEFKSPPAIIGRAIAEETRCEYEAIPNTGHFLQIERPDECMRAMESFLRKHRFIS